MKQKKKNSKSYMATLNRKLQISDLIQVRETCLVYYKLFRLYQH